MSTPLPTIMQGDNIIIIMDNESFNIGKDHMNYSRIKDAIQNNDWGSVPDLLDINRVINQYAKGLVRVVNGYIEYDGERMHNSLTKRMIAMLRDGFEIGPLVAFLENLIENPSSTAVDELYGFLEKNGLPITPDGYFIAYKKVKDDYTDVHTGTIDNSVGQTVKMVRHKVDDNRSNTCSAGLHFCSESYLNNFGGDRVMLVKINPRDVVSIPSDYNDSKGRCCKYEVIAEMGISAPVETEEVEQAPVYDQNSFS